MKPKKTVRYVVEFRFYGEAKWMRDLCTLGPRSRDQPDGGFATRREARVYRNESRAGSGDVAHRIVRVTTTERREVVR